MRTKITQDHIEQFAKYMSKKYGGKFTITAGSIETDANGSIDSWDLDYNGVENAGGSYIIKDGGDIVNVADNNEIEANTRQFTTDLIIRRNGVTKLENKASNLNRLIERIVDRKLRNG